MFKFKVLNSLWEIIVVKEINPNIHKHVSWRKFTTDDKCIQWEPKAEKPKWPIIIQATGIEEAREAYEAKLGKKVPNNKKNDIKWILSKL